MNILKEVLSLDSNPKVITDSHFYTIPRKYHHRELQPNFGLLERVKDRHDDLELLELIGSKETQLKVHLSRVHIPIVLPYIEDKLSSTDYIGINQQADRLGILYDFLDTNLTRGQINIIEPLFSKQLSLKDSYLLEGDFVFNPSKRSLYQDRTNEAWYHSFVHKTLSSNGYSTTASILIEHQIDKFLTVQKFILKYWIHSKGKRIRNITTTKRDPAGIFEVYRSRKNIKGSAKLCKVNSGNSYKPVLEHIIESSGSVINPNTKEYRTSGRQKLNCNINNTLAEILGIILLDEDNAWLQLSNLNYLSLY
tara:strand:+ start:4715 stop:5638 length:924 start_codon:yes stop_codon:yes gene_type:complete